MGDFHTDTLGDLRVLATSATTKTACKFGWLLKEETKTGKVWLLVDSPVIKDSDEKIMREMIEAKTNQRVKADELNKIH